MPLCSSCLDWVALASDLAAWLPIVNRTDPCRRVKTARGRKNTRVNDGTLTSQLLPRFQRALFGGSVPSVRGAFDPRRATCNARWSVLRHDPASRVGGATPGAQHGAAAAAVPPPHHHSRERQQTATAQHRRLDRLDDARLGEGGRCAQTHSPHTHSTSPLSPTTNATPPPTPPCTVRRVNAPHAPLCPSSDAAVTLSCI